MGGFGVIRCGGNDCVDHKFHLSILSPEEEGLSVSENLNFPFPFDEDEARVFGGSCGDWLCFHGGSGKIVIWNFTTKESKALPPPLDFNLGGCVACGIGYDAKVGDYKVIRYYFRYLETSDSEGVHRYAGSTDHFEVCSFKRPSWRGIKRPSIESFIENATGVYVNVTGSCYWPASCDLDHHVVSFDFSSESFDHLPLPETTLGEDARYTLVGFRGLLGAVAYLEPELSFSSELSIELHVWSLRKRSWKVLYVVRLADVARPISGLKDDRFLFLEAKASGGRSQLLVYDLYGKTEEKLLDIYDYPGLMNGVSYAESTDPPLSEPRRKRTRSRKVKKRKTPNVVGESSQRN